MTSFQFGGRSEQTKAASRRREDARALKSSGRWRGAMYMMGYAVECNLKAKLMEKYNETTLAGLERVLSRRFKCTADLRTHSVEYLFGFLDARDRLIAPNGGTQLLRAFGVCNTWSSQWRYDPSEGNEQDCDAFLDAAEAFCKFLEGST